MRDGNCQTPESLCGLVKAVVVGTDPIPESWEDE